MKTDHHLLILKPIKTTVVHDNPYVVIFHDIVSDKEITTLKRIATPYVSITFYKHEHEKQFIPK